MRERVGDIPLLLDYLIDRYTKKAGKKIRKIERKTLELFQAYNLVEAALAESRGRFPSNWSSYQTWDSQTNSRIEDHQLGNQQAQFKFA